MILLLLFLLNKNYCFNLKKLVYPSNIDKSRRYYESDL